MVTCSFTWIEWDKEGPHERQCSRNTWTGSDEYCIFHDPSPDKDFKLFKEKLEEQMQSEIKKHNFIGYYFPENWDFSGKEFKIDVDFKEATFQNAHFMKATFQNADFMKAIFHGYSYFGGTTFQGTAYFIRASFQNADFRKATFQGAYFGGTIFQGTADFVGVTFQNADFREATFQDAHFIKATFQNACFIKATFKGTANFGGAFFQKKSYFREAIFQDADFWDVIFQGTADFGWTTFQGAYFWQATFKGTADFGGATFQEYTDLSEATFQFVNFKELEIIYRNLKQNLQRNGNYSQAGDSYYREMEMRRKGTEKLTSRLWLELYNFLAGYGEKPELVIRNSFLVILLGAVLFFFCGIAMVGTEIPEEENPYIIDYSLGSFNFDDTTLRDFLYCLYYSVVTFTTLGYGDIHPLGYSHFFASVEALTGVFFMALFMVVFARKMMR